VDGVMNAQGNVLGSYLHGLFDDGQLFAAIAAHIRREKGIVTENQAPVSFQEFREREFDRIADIVRASVNMEAIYRIVRGEV
jgi:adenosylcobyric acid synthase